MVCFGLNAILNHNLRFKNKPLKKPYVFIFFLKYIFEILEFVEFLYIHKTQIYKVKMKINTQRIQMPRQNILREIDYNGNNKTDQIFSLADNNVIF